MRISIFREAKAHPVGKAEKVSNTFKCSAPYIPETVIVKTENELIDYITKYAWSPAIFNGVRKADNFVSTDFLVYDIDDGMTIDEADSKLLPTGFSYLILPSPSHTDIAPRFRIIIPLAHTIRDIDTFDATWQDGAAFFQTVDKQCSDSCRFYFASRANDGYWQEGDFLVPVKKQINPVAKFSPSQTNLLPVSAEIKDVVTKLYGKDRDKIPEAVDYFIKNAHTGMKGEWVNSLNSAAFSLALSKVADHVIIEVLESLCPEGSLDKKDIYQVKRAIRDGKKAL